MNQQITRNRFVHSSNSYQQSQELIIQPKRQERHRRHSHETIDPLRLVLGEEIGRGAFGVVYRGLYRTQTVAVKVFDLGDKEVTEVSMESMKNGLMREVDIWKNLDHPNVTKMIGTIMSMTTNSRNKSMKSRIKSSFCIVSEYVKGGSLRSYILKNRTKRLPVKIVFQFALDIAKGLSYLHSKRIIHFDVKPDNILIDNQYKLKLVDFGVSVFKPSEGSFLMNGEIGTRGYMAPRFGICLREMYCCDIAYPYDSRNNSIDVYKERPTIPKDCPRSLALLIQQCWDMDPSNRPEMKDVVVELEEIKKFIGWQAMSQFQQMADQ
ncbi:serine/threonine-protein kinase 54-like [Bidens hawaiensis]|uniref:serine/threonine-protein kinase 54-like n=1 Tax=Bidens hawaiensis TaxID=980011 RepID=UPI0040492985